MPAPVSDFKTTGARSEPDPNATPSGGDPVALQRASRGQEKQQARSRWDGVPLAIRLRHLKKVFVAHPRAAAVIAAINQRKTIRQAGGHPRGFMVIAPPGGGKTRLIEFLSDLCPPQIVQELLDPLDEDSMADRTFHEMVKFTIPNPCKAAAVANSILAGLQHPDCRGIDFAKQATLVKKQLILAETNILLVDNVQAIPELRGPKGTSSIGRLFVELIDECNLVVIFLGTELAEIVISANDQLRKRVPATLSLGGYDVSTREGLASAMRLLDMLDDEMPLSEKSGLGAGQLGRGLACAADGKVGSMVDLITASLLYTCADGRECLTLEDARAGYKSHFLDYSSTIDPFADGFIPRRLILPGEPHFTAIDDRRGGSSRGKKDAASPTASRA